MNKKEVAVLFKKQRKQSLRDLDSQYKNNKKCDAFYNNELTYYRDNIEFADEKGIKKRAMVNFGKVQENVDTVAGFMMQNRRQPKFVAHLNGSENQQLYSKNMNALYMYHRDNQNAAQLEGEQDLDLLIGGYGATETDLSYIVGKSSSTPNGDICKRRLTRDQVYWDGKATGKNLLDARWVGYSDEHALKDALDLFQNSTEDDFEQVDAGELDKGGYSYNPYGGVYDKIKALNTVEWSSEDEEIVRVCNHQWFKYETFYRAENPIYTALTPEDAMFYKARLDIIKAEQEEYEDMPDNIEVTDMFEFDPSQEMLVFDAKTKARLVEDFGDLIQPISFVRKCYYTAVVSGDHVFSCFKSISQQGFSIKFKTGSFNNTRKIWVGMVNAMMEPQEYYNKALTELLFALAANSKGGVIIEEDAVEDISEFSENYAKTDGVAIVRSGALAAGKVKPKTNPAVPTGLETILTLAEGNISANGVPQSFMGNVDKQDMAGILYKRLTRQIISKLAKYADADTLYQKEDARLHGDLIPVWVENNRGATIRIAGQDGSDEFFQLSEDALAPEYDVTIQESPQTPEDKEETAVLLGSYADRIMPVNPAAGQAFLAESLQLINIDGDIRNRLTQALQPQDMIPAQQAQAQIQALQGVIEQLQSQITQVEVQKKISEIEYNKAKVQAENAKTAETLESAANKGLENDLIRSGGYEKATVSI